MKTTLISYTDNLLLSTKTVNQSIKKIFLKVLKNMFFSFGGWGIIVFSNFRNKFYPSWCKNIIHLLKIKKIKRLFIKAPFVVILSCL